MLMLSSLLVSTENNWTETSVIVAVELRKTPHFSSVLCSCIMGNVGSGVFGAWPVSWPAAQILVSLSKLASLWKSNGWRSLLAPAAVIILV